VAVIHIGFTGTQDGMTPYQAEKVWMLVRYRYFYGHHGDCIGADKEFDSIVRAAAGFSGMVIHPCDIESKRAYCTAHYPCDATREVLPPLARNRVIVNESDCIIATPKETSMQLRSGTWTTVRYALEAHRPVAIVFPNGGLVFDGGVWP
jgi:hypothetical protein